MDGTIRAYSTSDPLIRLRAGSPQDDRFRVDSAGGVVALGALGIGLIPQTGAGERMMWYPFRSAFRVGSVTGSQWDDSNMGFYSMALGYNVVAKGNWSFAAGYETNVNGSYGVGLGYKAIPTERGRCRWATSPRPTRTTASPSAIAPAPTE